MGLNAYNAVATLSEMQALMQQFNGNEHQTAYPTRGGEMTPADDALGLDVLHYIFSTLLLMTARPDLVAMASLSRRVPAKKGREVKEFWEPAIIGANYRTRREANPPQGGTHASPRFHWVKGFWKEQAYGPKFSLRREQWIEPYTRGGE